MRKPSGDQILKLTLSRYSARTIMASELSSVDRWSPLSRPSTEITNTASMTCTQLLPPIAHPHLTSFMPLRLALAPRSLYLKKDAVAAYTRFTIVHSVMSLIRVWPITSITVHNGIHNKFTECAGFVPVVGSLQHKEWARISLLLCRRYSGQKKSREAIRWFQLGEGSVSCCRNNPSYPTELLQRLGLSDSAP